jgi:hypothetical protein
MRSSIARILHFNFQTAEDSGFWVEMHETKSSALSKEAIQCQLIKADETS